MRAMSPTGGALGNVSDNEGKRLEANLASLEKAQSWQELRGALKQISDYATESKGNLQQGFNDDFGEFLSKNQRPTDQRAIPTAQRLTAAQSAPHAPDAVAEGTIAHNPKTGERIVMKNGQWMRAR